MITDLRKGDRGFCGETETAVTYRAGNDKAEVRIGDVVDSAPFGSGAEYSPPARGTWTIAHTPFLVPDSLEIFVCPEGCLRGVVLSAAECGGTERFSAVAVKEEDLYQGDMEALFIEGASEILRKRDSLPKVCFIFTACIHHFLGLDRKLIFSALRERFPSVDFIESYMNCTMRKSKLSYEDVQWRQNYAGLHGSPADAKDTRQVNIIGSYFPTDSDSELIGMLKAGGYNVIDTARLGTYGEYRLMEKSARNIYHLPVAREACRDLSERLGQKSVYVPYTWEPDEIRELIRKTATEFDCPVPSDIDGLEERAMDALYSAGARFRAAGAEVGVDSVSTPRPFGLARLLTKTGFTVRTVYADTVFPEDEASFEALRREHPGIIMSAAVNFRMRLRPRDTSAKLAENGKLFVAVGQRAAYFSGTDRFVNMVANDGLWGFTGIEKLAHELETALKEPQDTRSVIQIKAKECRP